MEAVRPARLLFWFVLAALAVRVLWLLWHGVGQVTWDGAEYARLATNLLSGHGYLGLRGTTNFVFPPFYPIAIAALTLLVGDAARAGLAVSLVSGALFVIPVYALAAAVFSRRTGIVAAAVAAVLPFAVQLSTVVLADMLYLTLVTAGLAFLVRTAQGLRVRDAIGCSVAFALAYLTRPEGLLVEALGVAIVLGIAAWRAAARPRLPALALAVIVPFALLAAPYVAFLSANAGHVRVEGKSLLNLDIGLRMASGLTYAVAADAIDQNLAEVGPELDRAYYFEPRDRATPGFATVVAFALHNTLRHASEITHVALSRLNGTIVFALFVLGGMVAAVRTRASWAGAAILFAYGAITLLALASVYHFWERYFVGFVPLVVVFAAFGIELLARRFARRAALRVAVAGVAVFLAACTFSTRSGFTDDAPTMAEQQAGEWMAVNGAPGRRILGISDQAVFYAHGVWSMLPWAPDSATALRYVKQVDPAFVVLNSEYASERPYVTAWLAGGIPDRAAQPVYTIRQHGVPVLTVVRWHQLDEAKR